MPSAFENLCGPGKPLHAEPPDAAEIAGLTQSGLACLTDANNSALSLESRFDLGYNAAHALIPSPYVTKLVRFNDPVRLSCKA